MSCKDCDKFEEEGKIACYRWGDRIKLKCDYDWDDEFSGRTTTIKRLVSDDRIICYYRMKEVPYEWSEDEIDCLVESASEPINKLVEDKINNRFEILDLRR